MLKILGFDIGISSIGWALVENGSLKDCGVRIFTKAEHPKDGSSLALPRREARGSRRRLARRKGRIYALKSLISKEFELKLENYLADDGTLPKAFSGKLLSPYQLRYEALHRKLEKEEFARVILHIAKHRGYGNKHAKNDDSDNESGQIKKAISQNVKAMQDKGYESAGVFLYKEFYQKVRDFNKIKPAEKNTQKTQEFINVRNKKENYARCLDQKALQDELNLIFDKQREFNFTLSDKTYKVIDEKGEVKELDFKEAILEIAFFQRPLKSFESKVGKCTFFSDERRAPKHSLSAMEFVALGKINNLLASLSNISGEVYSKEKVNELLSIVMDKGEISYKKLRQILILDEKIRFPKVDYTKGNITTQIKNMLDKISKKVSPNKSCIYTKDQKMQIYDMVRKDDGISYTNLRQILNLETSIKFDDTILGKNKGLDYSKENVENTIANIKEKDPESSVFFKLENLEKIKECFESKKKQRQKEAEVEDIDGLDESNKAEVDSGIFNNLAQNYRDELDKIIEDVTNEKDKVKLRQSLESKNYKILKGKDKWLDSLSELNLSKRINLSFKALNLILPLMRKGLRYDEAVQKAGLKEVAKRTNKGDFLPPLNEYEPYLANPVVARALSEYRKVLNALLKKYGKVHKIHLELAREVGKSHDTKKKYEDKQKKNLEKINEAKRVLDDLGMPKNDKNILKIRLWREQDEYCAYSKEKICEYHLKDETALQVDHIYPYSRSFDDSYMNKVLVFTKANQNKSYKTPFEAFGENKEKWEMIKSFAKNFLPKQKCFRIINEKFANKQDEFKERNLNDTRYIARLALKYTKDNLDFLNLDENECTISGEKNSKVHVEAISGTLTANLRKIWGFEKKDRSDHLHHALDAIIIAHTNTSMIQRFSEYYKQKNELKSRLYLNNIDKSEYDNKKEMLNKQIQAKFCLPYGNFRQIVEESINKIFVSKPPRKRARGALHKESYGSICKENDEWVAKIKIQKEEKNGGKTNDKERYEILYKGEENIKNAFKWGKIRRLNKRNDTIQIGDKFARNERIIRLDIFKDKKGKFYGVPIYTMDFALGVLPNMACPTSVTDKKTQNLVEWAVLDSSYVFCFSLFPNDLILIKKSGMNEGVYCYYENFNPSHSSLTIAKHDNKAKEDLSDLSEDEKMLFKHKAEKGVVKIIGESVGIRNLKIFEKYQVSPLGEVKKAEFKERENISLKSSPKAQNEL